MSNSIDDLLGGGAAGKSMKFTTIGTSYSGVVVSSEPRAYTDISTGKPEFWDDGNPKMQAVIGIQTAERDPSIENDDGVRYDYVKMWGKQKQAFRAAAQAAGGSPAPGDHYSVTHTGTEPSKTRGFNDTKLYEYKIVKANPIDAALNAGPPATAAPVQQAAPAAQAATVPHAGLSAVQEQQVVTLIGKSLDDESIASVSDATAAEVSAARLRLAAAGSGGF